MEHTAADMYHLRETILGSFPSDALLLVTYPASRWSNLDPIDLVKQCVARIELQINSHAKGGYDEVILVGHSLGALFARKVCMLAHGICSDYASDSNFQPERRLWANSVSRLVLLAGMSRGWRLRPRNPFTPRVRWLARGIQYACARIFGFGRLVRATHRGSPFIVNLRLDWLSLINRDYPDRVPPEVVVQIAGMHDTVVHRGDHIDLQAGRNFKYYEVRATSHDGMIRFDDSEVGQERRKLFLYALQTPAGDFKGGLIPQIEPPDEVVSNIVLTTHGIRDYGKWQQDLSDDIAAEAKKRGLFVSTSISNYGYLPLIPFLFGWGRSVHTERLMDRYAELRARHPRAKCSFVGHSNGTYLLASALRRYQACKFDRVVFMGSIVQRNFPWLKEFRLRVRKVRNYVASSDAIVAVFPSLFEMIRIAPNRDLGSAGHTGFTQLDDNVRNVSYIQGGHSAALARQHRESLVSYLLSSEDKEDSVPQKVIDKQNGFVVLANRACVLIWTLLLAWIYISFVLALRVNLWLVQSYPWLNGLPYWSLSAGLLIVYGFVLFRL